MPEHDGDSSAVEQRTMMCPHCGGLFAPCDLIPYHDWPKPLRVLCPGSKQNPRCAESDGRPLWTGEPNPHFKGANRG